eukprot:TRINITY_DN12179_c0_g1_i1.p1 TRINITY_DN12179_c0_g1~~TRINITY_DN12179_c0_g1_i1.p1  ORF type:complete len:871 (+),score=95.27 TRINITY_DN12179_c0_g1_i1:321-2615(+)
MAVVMGGTDEVREFLKSIKLQQYADSIIADGGVSSVETLSTWNTDQFAECGVRRVHQKQIKENAQKWLKNNKENKTDPVVPSSGKSSRESSRGGTRSSISGSLAGDSEEKDKNGEGMSILEQLDAPGGMAALRKSVESIGVKSHVAARCDPVKSASVTAESSGGLVRKNSELEFFGGNSRSNSLSNSMAGAGSFKATDSIVGNTNNTNASMMNNASMSTSTTSAISAASVESNSQASASVTGAAPEANNEPAESEELPSSSINQQRRQSEASDDEFSMNPIQPPAATTTPSAPPAPNTSSDAAEPTEGNEEPSGSSSTGPALGRSSSITTQEQIAIAKAIAEENARAEAAKGNFEGRPPSRQGGIAEVRSFLRSAEMDQYEEVIIHMNEINSMPLLAALTDDQFMSLGIDPEHLPKFRQALDQYCMIFEISALVTEQRLLLEDEQLAEQLAFEQMIAEQPPPDPNDPAQASVKILPPGAEGHGDNEAVEPVLPVVYNPELTQAAVVSSDNIVSVDDGMALQYTGPLFPHPLAAVEDLRPDQFYLSVASEQQSSADAQQKKGQADLSSAPTLGSAMKGGANAATASARKKAIAGEKKIRQVLLQHAKTECQKAFPGLGDSAIASFACKALLDGRGATVRCKLFLTDKHILMQSLDATKERIGVPLPEVVSIQHAVVFSHAAMQIFTQNRSFFQLQEFRDDSGGGDYFKKLRHTAKGTPFERAYNYLDHLWRAACVVPNPNVQFMPPVEQTSAQYTGSSIQSVINC